MTKWRRQSRIITGVFSFGAAAVIGAGLSVAQSPPFSGDEDVAYANKLWQVLTDARLVGENSIKVRPFEGNEPHGTIQEVLTTTATVNGHTGRLLVKRNHGGKAGLTVEEVYDDPTKFLAAITVMFKREDGYDPDNQDWFWAKFKPNGELDKNPKGMQLAGRVAKGADKGCIACHSAGGGKDLEVLTSK